MRHEILVPFEIHTEAIEQKLEADAFDTIITNLTNELKAKAPKKWVGYDRQLDCKAIIEDAAMSFLEEHKDKILELAAKDVASRIARTKAFKEKVGELID